jgi:hypothetical protein
MISSTALQKFGVFEHSNLEFVSNFEFRFSDLLFIRFSNTWGETQSPDQFYESTHRPMMTFIISDVPADGPTT